MPEFEETCFRCNNPSCGYQVWASYEEDSAFLPDEDCPNCHAGKLIDTDEKRHVTRAANAFIDAPKRR